MGRNAPALKSVKVFELPGLRKESLIEWIGHMQNLETLIIFRAPELGKEAIDLILDSCPKLEKFGDFHSFDRRANDMKRLQQRISDEKDFNKLLSLHWFYLTEGPSTSNVVLGSDI